MSIKLLRLSQNGEVLWHSIWKHLFLLRVTFHQDTENFAFISLGLNSFSFLSLICFTSFVLEKNFMEKKFCVAISWWMIVKNTFFFAFNGFQFVQYGNLTKLDAKASRRIFHKVEKVGTRPLNWILQTFLLQQNEKFLWILLGIWRSFSIVLWEIFI